MKTNDAWKHSDNKVRQEYHGLKVDPELFSCGWINPKGTAIQSARSTWDKDMQMICRRIPGYSEDKAPEDFLLDAGWVEVRLADWVIFRKWPTDAQFDTMERYDLTTATEQSKSMFEVLNRKETWDIFFRADNYAERPWYNEFSMFRNIGICSVPLEQVFEVREALARFRYDTTTTESSDRPGYVYIIGKEAE